ncbi:NADH-quinone oxidoreductase subunit J family protein [Acidithiobacillus thiooxidans]|uniref:NADH-quinone oxidoreductase subunit J family protein n=1 Tax=Acidithiobacillus thiooxidans TaxID=930 RepID=UPI0009D980B0|nr:NADH-quinone oxidoreductase subunit J [Acidithiobacillus thiooxidans]
MTIFLILLLLLIILTTGAALLVVRDPMHGAVNLGVSLLALSILFLVLGAPFVAALEVMLYVGAILVLFLFAIMLLRTPLTIREEPRWRRGFWWPAVLVVLLAAVLILLFSRRPDLMVLIQEIGPGTVGRALFGPYLWLTEAVALLLFAVIAAVLAIHRRDDHDA